LKKNFETLACLGFRYTALDDYRNALLLDLVKPLKRKKRFSFLNPENLLQVQNTATEGIINIPHGGLRSLFQEFEQGQNRLIN
jgi:hypothetical protein